jgi:CRP-like cAMP-binding protein
MDIVCDPNSFLPKAGEGRTLAKHDRNQVVFAQGDPAVAVFYIQEGRVKVSSLSRSGKEAVLAFLGPGDFFGEGCLNDQPLRTVTATIMAQGSILRLEKAAMLRLLHDEPKFSELFIGYLLQRNSRIEEDLVDHKFNSSEKRLARLLLLMANFSKDGDPESVIASISQETLAEMIGTTRSRVNFFMNKFRRMGFIDYCNGGLRIQTRLAGVILRD